MLRVSTLLAEKRPILPIGLAVCLGVLCGLKGVGTFGHMAILASGVVVSLGAVLLLARGRWRQFLLSLILISVGSCGLAWWRGQPEIPAVVSGNHGDRVTVRGVVAGDPGTRVDAIERGVRVTFPFQITTPRETGYDHASQASLLVVWYGSATRLPRYGEEWRFRGRLRCFENRGRTSVVLYTGQSSGKRLSSGKGWGWLRRCFDFRSQSGRYLTVGLEQPTPEREVIQALVLGYRDGMDRDTRDLFVKSGTLHIFAISGLHVGIVASFLVFALRHAGVPRTRWALFIIPLLFLYTCSTGMRASAWRAFVMASVFFAAPMLGRRRDGASALITAGIIILLVSPAQLLDIGFIYSFAVVSGIMLLYPLLVRPWRRFWQGDPLRLDPEPRWVRVWRGWLRWVSQLFALSCSAWLASVPLTAHFFGRISLYAVLDNMVAVPMAYLVVLTGALSLVIGSAADWLAALFNRCAWLVVWLLVRILRVLVSLPGALLEIPQPPGWVIVMGYVAAGIALLVLKSRCLSNTNGGSCPSETGGEVERV